MHDLKLFADYHQIHVFDDGSDGDLADAWTEGAVADHMAVNHDIIGIGTTVNVFVSVSVDVLQAAPADDSASFDHVVEASLYSSSGRLAIMGCTGYEPDAERFAVKPGWLRLRASQSNLLNAYRAGIDSDENEETMERIRVQIWPAPEGDLIVLRRWSPPED